MKDYFRLFIELLLIIGLVVVLLSWNKSHAELSRKLIEAGLRSASFEERMDSVIAAERIDAGEHDSLIIGLIYCLSDPDHAIANKANSALQRISSRTDVVELKQRPTEDEKVYAMLRWSQWYLYDHRNWPTSE